MEPHGIAVLIIPGAAAPGIIHFYVAKSTGL